SEGSEIVRRALRPVLQLAARAPQEMVGPETRTRGRKSPRMERREARRPDRKGRRGASQAPRPAAFISAFTRVSYRTCRPRGLASTSLRSRINGLAAKLSITGSRCIKGLSPSAKPPSCDSERFRIFAISLVASERYVFQGKPARTRISLDRPARL